MTGCKYLLFLSHLYRSHILYRGRNILVTAVLQFLPRRTCINVAYAVVRCLSALLAVCLSCLCIVSKRVVIFSNLFLPSGSYTINFAVSNVMTRFQWGSPNWGVECCRWGIIQYLAYWWSVVSTVVNRFRPWSMLITGVDFVYVYLQDQ